MLRLFIKKTQIGILKMRYDRIIKQYFALSGNARLKGIRMVAQANEILNQIQALQTK